MAGKTRSTGMERIYSLGFKHPGVAAGERAEVEASPAMDFVGHEVAVSDPKFELLDVIVGGRSQFQSSERRLWPMDPKGTFRFVSHLEHKPLDVAERGSSVKLLVRNTSGKTTAFFGAIFGTPG